MRAVDDQVTVRRKGAGDAGKAGFKNRAAAEGQRTALPCGVQKQDRLYGMLQPVGIQGQRNPAATGIKGSQRIARLVEIHRNTLPPRLIQAGQHPVIILRHRRAGEPQRTHGRRREGTVQCARRARMEVGQHQGGHFGRTE